jgi:hypothetical protein
VLVQVLVQRRGTRVQEPESVPVVGAERVARGRATMGMGRRRSSFTSLAVRAVLTLPVLFSLLMALML